MSLYQNFIGIDIGKFTFVAAIHNNKGTKEYENNSSGIKAFIKEFKKYLSDSLLVLETTGGYEMNLLLSLCDKQISVHRANARMVKSFIRSLGNGAKTDGLDAKALALYAYERSDRLKIFTPGAKDALALYELVQRRRDLKQMLIAEKNRLQAPKSLLIKSSCERMIKIMKQELEEITVKLNIRMQSWKPRKKYSRAYRE